MDVTVTIDGAFNGGWVDAEIREHDSGGSIINTAQTRFDSNNPIRSLSGFAGQDGTRSYSSDLTLKTPDGSRSPEVQAVSIDAPNLDYYGKWRFDGIVLPGHNGPEETHTYGESYTLEVWLSGELDTESSPWPDKKGRYRELRQWQPHAGDFTVYEAIGGRIYFREQHNTKPSMLIALRPPANTDGGCGLGGYYLVSSVADGTVNADALIQMDFDLQYVAGLDEFADAAAVRDAREATGP